MAFDPDNPFGFNNWRHSYDSGGDDTGDDLELGNRNFADANDSTQVSVIAADNAALVGSNLERDHAGVGIFGVSLSEQYGMGAAGFCAAGVGVYGVSQVGLGVVGRVMGNDELESNPLEILAPNTGVFGQAFGGTGVRGHGGTFSPRQSRDESDPRSIGGVFSAGELQDTHIPGADGRHEVSIDALAQMQLIPSQSEKLPDTGRLGEMFLSIRGDLPARLFICTKFSGSTPMWQQVAIGGSFIPSGSSI
jgi:hypothetical protein